MLTNVMRVDVGTISGVSLLYLGVVTLAVAVPAARALRLDPATILRTE